MSKKYQPRLGNRFQHKAPLAKSESRLGEQHLLQVEDLNHQGQGVAKLSGKPVFIADALPTEQVLVEIEQENASIFQARVISIEQAAAYRQAPACAHFGVCGGCVLQHCTAEQQLELKKRQLIRSCQGLQKANSKKAPKLGQRKVKPAPGFDFDKTSILTAAEFGYRRRARLGVSACGQLGFRQRGSNDTVAISQCLVLTPVLQTLLLSLNEWLAAYPQEQPWSSLLGHIELIDAQPQALAILRRTGRLSVAAVAALTELATTQGFRLAWQGAEPVEASVLSYNLPGLELQFDNYDFIQVNPELNQLMVQQAVEWLAPSGSETVLDLYCGVGNFSLPIARQARRLVGVEVSAAMVAKAQNNALRNGIDNADFIAADLDDEQAISALQQLAVDAVLLDPPRTGAAGIMPFLSKLNARCIVYVSCNPSTLVRDAKQLLSGGYHLKRLSAMDMFPNTSHLEAMALFERRK